MNSLLDTCITNMFRMIPIKSHSVSIHININTFVIQSTFQGKEKSYPTKTGN